MIRVPGPLSSTAPTPPWPCPTPRAVPSIAVTRSTSSNAPTRLPTRPPTSRDAGPPPESGRPRRSSERDVSLPERPSRSTRGADEAGRDVEVESRHLPRGEFRQGDPGHRGVVGAEAQRGDGQLDSQVPGHLGDLVAKPGVARHAAADAEPSHPVPEQRLSGLADQDVDHRLLEARGDDGDDTAGGRGRGGPRILPADRIEDGRLQAREAERK